MEYFVAIRVRGQVDKIERFPDGGYFVDINISLHEANRLVQFVSSCLRQEEIKNEQKKEIQSETAQDMGKVE